MNEALAQVTSKCLTHSALDEDCNRGTTANNTPSESSTLVWKRYHPVLIQRSDALYWPLFRTDGWVECPTFSWTLPSWQTLTCAVCQLMVRQRWIESIVHPKMELWWLSKAMGQAILNMNQCICFKDWLEVFLNFKCCLYVYLEKSHNESINYICTYCSKDSYTVREMQVLSF